MSRVRYVTPSIDEHCGSEPGDIAAALVAKGLALMKETRMEAVNVGVWDLAAALEYAGAAWALEATGQENAGCEVWAPPWMNDALKALRKMPEFRSASSVSPDRKPLWCAAYLRELQRAVDGDPELPAALAMVCTLVPVGGRAVAMVEFLMTRRVWNSRALKLDLGAWERALVATRLP